MKSTFKLIGLNKPWHVGGFNSIYATVEKGKEDWFHCAFEAKKFPDDKLKSLFDLFKNSEENLWHDKNHRVVVEFDLENPLIIELILDDSNFEVEGGDKDYDPNQNYAKNKNI